MSPDEPNQDIHARIQRALAAIHPEVSKYTFPLFAVNQRGRPELYASSVLVDVDDTAVLLTAAHAVYEITSTGSEVYIGASKIILLSPRFIQTSKEGKDKLDLAAIVVPEGILRSEDMQVLPHSSLCLERSSIPPHIRCIHGFPVTKNTTHKRADEKRKVFTKYGLTYAGVSSSVEVDYARYGKQDNMHLALLYEQQSRNESGVIVTPPKPRGISGGGLWSIPDLYNPQTFFLEGIAIEYHDKLLVFASRIEHAVKFIRQSVLSVC